MLPSKLKMLAETWEIPQFITISRLLDMLVISGT
tara:strand:- start:2578 stop:2679 length:102 start_codon:yes stop_codon:yes gene_type:complete